MGFDDTYENEIEIRKNEEKHMEIGNPDLTIYVTTYNHEKYIVQALDSILMQETKYSYEVLVGEDCSTDSTRTVLQQYELAHPGLLTVFYREHNMYHEKVDNFSDLVKRARGRYVIALEGDDYWIDPHKIEKQISFLDEHKEYLAVAHRCIVVNENSENTNTQYRESLQPEYTFQMYASSIMPGQLTTVMCRNTVTNQEYNKSIFEKKAQPGDRVIYFWLLCNGRIHCMPDVMSAYRYVTDHGSSWSATHKYNYEREEYLNKCLLAYAKELNHKEAISFAEFMLFRSALSGSRRKQCTWKRSIKIFEQLTGKYQVLIKLMQYIINNNILHKRIWLS